MPENGRWDLIRRLKFNHRSKVSVYITHFSRSAIKEFYYSLMMEAELFSETFNHEPEL